MRVFSGNNDNADFFKGPDHDGVLRKTLVMRLRGTREVHALLEMFWRISLYLADDVIAELYVTYSFVKWRETVEKCRHI